MRRALSGAAVLLALFVSVFSAPVEAVATPAPEAARSSSGPVVTFDGWGGLRLGMDVDAAWRTGMVSHQLSSCAAGYQMAPKYRDRGFVWWAQRGPLKVEKIVISGSVDRTAAGAHVGSTLRQLHRLYPRLRRPARSAVAVEHAAAGTGKDLWVTSIVRAKGTLNFQFAFSRTAPTAASKVEKIVVARKPDVFWGC